jgi:TolB-like protein
MRYADGLTEDITTDLARFRDILVIASISSELYRGKAEDVRVIAQSDGPSSSTRELENMFGLSATTG